MQLTRMSREPENLVLPRPRGGAATAASSHAPPIPGPTESAFTAVFGALLPPAQYLHTPAGKAAYYEIFPIVPASASSSSSPGETTTSEAHAPDRVLFIHGVQTPALGMLPLARALHAAFPQAHFVLIDLWGHGLSDTPVVPHEAELFHGLLDALLDRLGWPCTHLVGFSFGAALTVGYVGRVSSQQTSSLSPSPSSQVKSFVLVAPAGLIRAANFTPEQQGFLRRGGGGENNNVDVDEVAAQRFVLTYLEGGGDLVVSADWRDRVARGEVVAEAVRAWQMREHAGHTASVVGIFRDGGVMDQDAAFVRAAGSGVPSLVVLGGLDELSSVGRLKGVGFGNIKVVHAAGHGVVREKVPEVAGFIEAFWRTELRG